MDTDNSTTNGVGSCFPPLIALAKKVGAKFDPFLLADVFNDLKSGEAYEEIDKRKKEDKFNGRYMDNPDLKKYDTPFDEHKVLLIYTQIQYISKKHPDREIEFHFFDDRQDILIELKNSFEKHPELLPKNVILHLHNYAQRENTAEDAAEGGRLEESSKQIQGTGDVHFNFREVAKNLVKGVLNRSSLEGANKDPIPLAAQLKDWDKEKTAEVMQRGNFSMVSALSDQENKASAEKENDEIPHLEKIPQDSQSVTSMLSTKAKVQRIMLGGSIGALVLGGGSLACTIAFGAAFGVTGLALIAIGPVGWVIGGVAIAGFIAGALAAKETYRPIPLENNVQSPEGTTKPSLKEDKNESKNSPSASAQTLFAPLSQVHQLSRDSSQVPNPEVI